MAAIRQDPSSTRNATNDLDQNHAGHPRWRHVSEGSVAVQHAHCIRLEDVYSLGISIGRVIAVGRNSHGEQYRRLGSCQEQREEQ